MKKLTYLLLLIFIALISNSCGTIFNGTNQEINIVSDPIDAMVIINDQEFGKTPIVVELERKENHIIRIELDGYEPEIITVNRKTSGWFIGNCLFGGLIGMVIDAITGGMYVLKPEEVNAVLTPSEQLAVNNGEMLYVKLVTKVNPDWEKVGQLKKTEQ